MADDDTISVERNDLRKEKREILKRFERQTADKPCPGELVLVRGSWHFLARPPYVGEHLKMTDIFAEGEDDTGTVSNEERQEYADRLNRQLGETVALLQPIVDELNREWQKMVTGMPVKNLSSVSMKDLVRVNDLLGYEGEGPKVIMDKLLCQGWIALLAGASKSYKSWLSLQLALEVSRGGNWLGIACKPRKVLYVDYELSHHSLQNRLKNLGLDSSRPCHGPDFLIMRDIGSDAMEAEQVEVRNGRKPKTNQVDLIIRKIFAAHGKLEGVYDLIVLDPLYMFLEGRDENSASDMVQVFGEIRNLKAATGAAILINAHFRKGVRDSRVAASDQISGSGVFVRYPDVVMTLSRYGDGKSAKLQKVLENRFQLDFTLRHLRGIDPLAIEFDKDKSHFKLLKQKEADDTILEVEPTKRGRGKKSTRTISNFLRNHHKDLNGKTLPEVVPIVSKGTKYGPATVYRYFQRNDRLIRHYNDRRVVNLTRYEPVLKVVADVSPKNALAVEAR